MYGIYIYIYIVIFYNAWFLEMPDWKCTGNSLCDVVPQISKNPVRQEGRGVNEKPGWWVLTKIIKEPTKVSSHAIFHSSLVKISLTSCFRHWGLVSGLWADALLTLEVPFSPLWYFYNLKGQRIFLLKQSQPILALPIVQHFNLYFSFRFQ